MSEYLSMDERLEKFSQYLDSPEGEASIQKQVDEWEQERNAKIEFYESEEFEQILKRFDASENLSISCDKIDDDIGDMIKVFDSILECNYRLMTSDNLPFFSTQRFVWREYLLTRVHGQGSVHDMHKLSSVSEIPTGKLESIIKLVADESGVKTKCRKEWGDISGYNYVVLNIEAARLPDEWVEEFSRCEAHIAPALTKKYSLQTLEAFADEFWRGELKQMLVGND